MNKNVVIRKATGHISIQATGLDALRILECIAAATNNIPMNARAVRGMATVTPDICQRVNELADAGMSLQAIARELRISKTTAWKIRKGIYPMTKVLAAGLEGARSIPARPNSLWHTDVALRLLGASEGPQSAVA